MMYVSIRHVNKYTPRIVNMALLFLVSVIFLSAVSSLAWARDPAPVFEGSTRSGSVSGSIEKRLSKIERRLNNQTLTEVLTRLDELQQEIQRLSGDMELQAHNVDGMKKRQRELYLDIDRRLGSMEKAVEKVRASQAKAATSGFATSAPSKPFKPVVSPPVASTPLKAGSVTPVRGQTRSGRGLEREAYQRAFNLLKEGRYKLAIASFRAFIETFPKVSYAANAQYWLGEANYVQKNYQAALTEFQKVIDNYPGSKKTSDAMLKMGYTYEQIGNKKQAQRLLNSVVKKFTGSTAAQLASRRLQDMKRTR